MILGLKSFGKQFSEGLPLVMVASTGKLEFIAFGGIESEQI